MTSHSRKPHCNAHPRRGCTWRRLGVLAALLLQPVPLETQDRVSSNADYAALALPAAAEDVTRLLCGTPEVVARQMRSGFAPAALASTIDVDTGLRDGLPLRYDQRPRLIRADDPGGLAFEDFLVVGDVATLAFDRSSASAEDHVISETWTRTGTTAVNGRLLSVFDPTWSHDELWDSLGWRARGFDKPRAYFGTLRIPAEQDADEQGGGTTESDDDVTTVHLWLAVAPLNLPESRVERIDDATQYASHVVNLVVPGFGDGRLATDDHAYGFDAATRRFYRHFADEYDSIAVVAAETVTSATYAAFHRNVRNPIAGLGLPVYDNSAHYGSSGVLRSVELYAGAEFTTMDLSHHEIGHQWVDFWDWSALVDGVDFGDQGNHTPLVFPGEAMTSVVLPPERRVARSADGEAFVIERTPAPALLQLSTAYRMGLLGPEHVPEMVVFENQEQFDRNDTPEAGTVIDGGWRTVHINDVLAEHGTRSGPVDSSWRRATIVVSLDESLSPEEMDYWNFFAARHAATEGVTTFEGVPSYYEATGDRMRLHTDITPRTRAKIARDPLLPVSYTPIDPREFRGVQLDEPVPGLISVDETVTIAGRITATDRDDFNSVCVRWRRHAEEGVLECARVHGNRFSIPYRFTREDAGHYMLAVFLFWPGSGPQYGRSYITGITVE